MKQKNLKKEMGSLLLTAAMLVTAFPGFSTNVYAVENQLPTKEQFATVDDLKSFNTDDTDGKNSAKLYFGNNNQQWWIAGNQDENLILFAASPLAYQKFKSDWNVSIYDAGWGCEYPEDTPEEVWPNHYGASPIRKILKDMENDTTYFSVKEQGLMNNTKVYADDTSQNVIYFMEDKLYLAFGNYDYNDVNNKHITVGENSSILDINSGLHIDFDYWPDTDFWLRGQNGSSGYISLIGKHDEKKVIETIVNFADLAIVPAFELDLSSVIFGSVVPAATTDVTLQDVDGDGTFTLRYRKDDIGSAMISLDKKKVSLKDVKKGIYLVVQNSDGAYAKQITDEISSVSAKDMNLDSFANCKVWLETTDTNERMTYATLATDEQLNYDLEVAVNITIGSKHIGYKDVDTENINIKNTGNVDATNINVILTGKNADVFTLDITTMQTALSPNEETIVTVKPNQDLSVGTYTAELQIKGDVNIAKTASISFTVEDHDYKDEWTTDKDKHWHECDCGTKSDGAEHTFKWIIDKEATHIEKGSKHEECEICGYKKVSVEIPVVEHIFIKDWIADENKHWHECDCGVKAEEAEHRFKWVVDKEATHKEKGSKHEECEICGYKKASVEIPVVNSSGSGKSNTDKSNTDNSSMNNPDTNIPNHVKGIVETGDQINIGLYVFLFAVSVLSIVSLVIWKKKKVMEKK